MVIDSRDPPVELPLLDRLLDDDPDQKQDMPRTRRQSIRQLRAGVCRDIEMLLNMRRCFLPPPDELEQLPRSLASFGLRDLTNETSNLEETGALAQLIQRTVVGREPRLQNVDVKVDKAADQRLIRFKVNALLRTRESLDNIVIEAQVEPIRRAMQVKESE